jgi:hypothetical protein
MLRTRSMSSIDDLSSVGTGNSIQMAIEGQWDEGISIRDIHDGVIQHLSEKLEILKRKYVFFKSSQGAVNSEQIPRVVRKIVAARINYQRYLNVTRDILEKCNDFVRSRKDTPASRIAFIRNVQEYFSQAKDFIRLDISLRKISPTLLQYVQPRTTDSPQTYRRKRDMCRVMSSVVNNDRNCVLNSTTGKLFRSRYAQQNKFTHTDFPDSWTSYLPLVLRNALANVSDVELRWIYTIIYMFSKHCTANYLQQGYCPTCVFPIVNERGKGTAGGKLFCPACKKEIEWTYYMNPRTICLMIMGFHPMEIDDVKKNLIEAIRKDPGLFSGTDSGEEQGTYFEDVLEEYLLNYGNYVDIATKRSPGKDTVFRTFSLETDPGQKEPRFCVEDVDRGLVGEMAESCQLESASSKHLETKEESSLGERENVTAQECSQDDSGHNEASQYQSMVMRKAATIIRNIYGKSNPLDLKMAKDTYQLYRAELMAFEGKQDGQIPRGLIPKIERYVCHYFKVPSKEEVRKLPLDEKGERQGTSRRMIAEALKELGLDKYSGCISNIANKMWGTKLPNMSKHHVDILTDCVVQKEVFTRMSTHGRKSNLNQRLILMHITNRYGYPWDANDFRVNFANYTFQKQMDILTEIFRVIDEER